jgi:hypothetical protein
MLFVCAAAVAAVLASVEVPAPRAQEGPAAAPAAKAPERYRAAYAQWRGRLRQHDVYVGRRLVTDVRAARLRRSIWRMQVRWGRWLRTSPRGRALLFERKVRRKVPGWGRSHLRSIAGCESHHNPRAVGGGGTYRGMYQFSFSTWRVVGGRGDPASASRSEQTWRAWLLLSRHGAGHWPNCG